MASHAVAAAGTQAVGFFGRLFRSKTFWLVFFIIVVLWIIWRNQDRIKQFFGRTRADFQPGSITEGRKSELEALANDAYNAIYGVFGDTGDTLERVNALNDNELVYLAKFYKKALTKGSSLYKDVDDEFMPWDKVDEQLMGRLSQLNMKT